MARKRNSSVECVQDEERLILRYSFAFRRRAIVILLLALLLGVGLLAVPLAAIVGRRFLEIVTWGTFLLIIGGIIIGCALMGWIHMVWYGWRDVVFDRGTGTCSIPMALFRRRCIPLRDIKGVRIRRKRLEAGTYRNIDAPELWATHHQNKDSLWLVLAKPHPAQRIWGRLGLPHDAEELGETIAAFLGRSLERQPARHFERQPGSARR